MKSLMRYFQTLHWCNFFFARFKRFKRFKRFDPAEVIISAFYVDTCCVNFDMDININMLMPKSEGVGGEKFDQNFATFY